ncbi:MAG: DUF4214 domain-containing protein [Pseudomonadota bacterium]
MTTTADLQNTTLSGLLHIDALLDSGPDWNYQNPGGNVIRYTFSIASGNEDGVTGQVAFNAAQQAVTREFLNGYLSALTGIQFVETSDGTNTEFHFAYHDIPAANTTGLCASYSGSSTLPNGTVTAYGAESYIYLDNVQFGARNQNLVPGTQGFQTLLHEIGHALGLKHPFDDNPENHAVLPFWEDSSSYTVMSYFDLGGPYAEYSPYDVAALMWLYGGDGLGGALGVNSTTGARYITGTADTDALTGTAFNDTLRGNGADDIIDGGAGDDTAVYSGASGSYTFTMLQNGSLRVNGADGVDTLTRVENLVFSNGNFRVSELVDNVAPSAPTQSVAKNAAGFVVGNKPYVAGIAEAHATVKVYSGATLIGTGSANAEGFFGITTSALGDGSYSITSTATDGAGNVSAASAAFAFKVDATPPAAPTGTASATTGNQPALSGTADAGTVINLVNAAAGANNEVIGNVVAGAGGTWSLGTNPLANGTYSVKVQSIDSADNITEAASPISFTINSASNRAGTTGNDVLVGTADNNALSGLAGIDTAQYAGARAAYTVVHSTNGHTVSSTADGLDSLLGVERIQFADSSLAIDIEGNGGQAYRLYRAAFDRAPDLGGVGFWIAKLDQGVTLQQAAGGFIASAEFTALYGANSTDFTFVSKLYEHVLHRSPDGSGFDFWMNALAQGISRADILFNFSESAENEAQVIGQIENGFAYIPFVG